MAVADVAVVVVAAADAPGALGGRLLKSRLLLTGESLKPEAKRPLVFAPRMVAYIYIYTQYVYIYMYVCLKTTLLSR